MAEVRRLLAACGARPPQLSGHRGLHHALSWSNWRRRRQAVARRCHYLRRCRTIEGEALDRATGNVQAAVDMAKSWLDMQRGIVLREIRDSELYKIRADTFEAYVSARWSMSRPRAYELIKAAPIQLAVSGKTDTPPPSTSHALALAAVYEEAGPEGAAKILQQVQATAEESGKRATAQTVRKVARALGYGQPAEAASADDENQAPDPEAGRRAMEALDQDRETLRRIYDRLGENGLGSGA